MSQERLKQLFSFLKEDPNDPFILYAIATEYNVNEPDKALPYFEKLLRDHPDYVPTYYHAAKLYADRDEPEKAEQTFKRGIIKAEQKKDELALRELKNAYQEFLFDQD
ncbi:MAG: tetratricopeptide repeat protein [Cyclobacteriaceae bacterium]